MSAYTQPIIRYGLITPAIFNCVLLGGVLFGISKVTEMRKAKEALYQEETARRADIKQLEAEIAPKRKTFSDQKKLLDLDPGHVFTRLVDMQLPKYKEVELERSGLVFPLERGKIASQLKSEAGRVKSSFQGGLGPMEEMLLQIESMMPQAVLEDMKITRKADALISQREYLVLEMTHTCWKAGDNR